MGRQEAPTPVHCCKLNCYYFFFLGAAFFGAAFFAGALALVFFLVAGTVFTSAHALVSWVSHEKSFFKKSIPSVRLPLLILLDKNCNKNLVYFF